MGRRWRIVPRMARQCWGYCAPPPRAYRRGLAVSCHSENELQSPLLRMSHVSAPSFSSGALTSAPQRIAQHGQFRAQFIALLLGGLVLVALSVQAPGWWSRCRRRSLRRGRPHGVHSRRATRRVPGSLTSILMAFISEDAGCVHQFEHPADSALRLDSDSCSHAAHRPALVTLLLARSSSLPLLGGLSLLIGTGVPGGCSRCRPRSSLSMAFTSHAVHTPGAATPRAWQREGAAAG